MACAYCEEDKADLAPSPYDEDDLICGACRAYIAETAPVARGYGEFMRRRYERGELQHGPPQSDPDG